MGKVLNTQVRGQGVVLQLINLLLVVSVTTMMLFRTILYQKDYLKQAVMTIVNAN